MRRRIDATAMAAAFSDSKRIKDLYPSVPKRRRLRKWWGAGKDRNG